MNNMDTPVSPVLDACRAFARMVNTRDYSHLEPWLSPNINRSEALEVRQSQIDAARNGDESNEAEDDLPIFVSDTKTVIKSLYDSLFLGKREETGIACFGSVPFVMQGDFLLGRSSNSLTSVDQTRSTHLNT
jgi:hypothetical protein